MALLKRIKASTLIETLVATVLIVIIFMVSSMILNNLLSGKIKENTEIVQERLNTLEYQYLNGGIRLPYYEDFENWEITIAPDLDNGGDSVLFTAENISTKKKLTTHTIYNYEDR